MQIIAASPHKIWEYWIENYHLHPGGFLIDGKWKILRKYGYNYKFDYDKADNNDYEYGEHDRIYSNNIKYFLNRLNQNMLNKLHIELIEYYENGNKD